MMIYDFSKSLDNYFQSSKPRSFPLQSCITPCMTCNVNLRDIPQAQANSQARAQNPSPEAGEQNTVLLMTPACILEVPKDRSTFQRLRPARARRAM